MFRNKIGRPLFSEDVQYLKLPYDVVWIDYLGFINKSIGVFSDGKEMRMQTTKEAILAINGEGDNEIIMFGFTYLPSMGKWAVSAIGTDIHIGVSQGLHAFKYWDHNYGNLDEKEPRDLFDVGKLSVLELFMLLLNCKNIEAECIKPSERLNMRRRKNGRQELFSYKILKIKQKMLGASRSKNEPLGGQNRIHLCRGHFKEYTKEHPLFGRITGLWWWQPHVRGQNRDGIVMKDYAVESN